VGGLAISGAVGTVNFGFAAPARSRYLVIMCGGIDVTVLAALAGVVAFSVRRSLRPLADIKRAAYSISAGDLTRRAPDDYSDTENTEDTEVGQLARAFNTMMSQVEAAFIARGQSEERMRRSQEKLRQFVADAAHELRTPLTAIRGIAQFSRQNSAAADSERDAYGRIEEVAERMSLLVDDLLLLARLDETRPLERRIVDLLEVAAAAVTEARLVDPDRAITLDVRADAAYHVTGDPARLRQVIANLLTNALRHTPAGSPVSVRLSAADGSAVLEVADEGPGLTPEQALRVFDRFYRADASRSRDSAGSGLGLSIVAGLMAAHGGAVDVRTHRELAAPSMYGYR